MWAKLIRLMLGYTTRCVQIEHNNNLDTDIWVVCVMNTDTKKKPLSLKGQITCRMFESKNCARALLHMGVPHAVNVKNLALVGLWSMACFITLIGVSFLSFFFWCQIQYHRILKCGLGTISSLFNERDVCLPIIWGLVSRFNLELRLIIGVPGLQFTSLKKLGATLDACLLWVCGWDWCVWHWWSLLVGATVHWGCFRSISIGSIVVLWLWSSSVDVA